MLRKSPEMFGIFRIDQEKTERRSGTHGWQVRLSVDNEEKTKLFSDSKFASKSAALEAAKTYRDRLLKKRKSFDPELQQFLYHNKRIHTTLPKNNTSGIIGVNRTEGPEKSGNITAKWQTTFPTPDVRARTRKFAVKKYGELTALYKAIEIRVEALNELIGHKDYIDCTEEINVLTDRYLNIMIYLEQLNEIQSKELFDIINNKNIPNTKKEDIILGRVGQQTFRAKIFKLWKSRCAVTGATLFLTAAHIKPWKVSTDRERLDPYNGLLLSPVYDKAFDHGYISFSDDGKIMISNLLISDMAALGISYVDRIRQLSPLSHKYLDYHRSSIFRNELNSS